MHSLFLVRAAGMSDVAHDRDDAAWRQQLRRSAEAGHGRLSLRDHRPIRIAPRIPPEVIRHARHIRRVAVDARAQRGMATQMQGQSSQVGAYLVLCIVARLRLAQRGLLNVECMYCAGRA